MRVFLLLFRILLGFLLTLALIPVLLLIALNTGAGRHFAEKEINKFAGPSVHISGLAGHIPADIKLAGLTLSDAKGAWLTGRNLELRWHPFQLIHRTVAIQALTASSITVIREPVSGKGNSSLPNLQVELDRLEIGAFNLSPALAGEAVTLHVQGAAHLRDATHGSATLNATTPDGNAQYHLDASINDKNASVKLHIFEPPGGLLGHLAGASIQAPLHVDATLSGPRQHAALDFTASLGAAQLAGTGTLGLEPEKSFADLVITARDLAPFGALVGQPLGGNTRLHLVLTQQPDNRASLFLTGTAKLQALPSMLQKLLGNSEDFSLRATLHEKSVMISQLKITGENFSGQLSGTLAKNNVNLTTSAQIPQVSVLSPELSGNVQASGHVTGTTQDLAAKVQLTGTVTAEGIPSAPFSITLDTQHWPHSPVGTLTGSGELEHFPLKLDASLSRTANGTTNININTATWRSLKAQADLRLPPGAILPVGTAKFSADRLEDLSPLLPLKIQGAASGDFAYTGGETVELNLTARHLVAVPQIGAIDGRMKAQGKLDALAVTAQLQSASLFSSPASLALTGTVNLPARAARVSSLNAAWHGLQATLLGPTEIETKPDIAVHHLALTLNNGRITLDGILYPHISATAQVQNLPVSLAKVFVPTLDATGTLSASANLTGTLAKPSGKMSLDARALHLATGPAAALPPANVTGTADLKNQSASISVKLAAGPHLNLATQGTIPLQMNGAMNLHIGGQLDLRLLDPILGVQGSVARGVVQTDLTLIGSPKVPLATGSVVLSDGSVQNIGSGFHLTQIYARVQASGQTLTLQSLKATAGNGSITGGGTVNLAQPGLPIKIALNATGASPISSDTVTATLDAALTLNGDLRGRMALGGKIYINKAEINIPHALPPSVANLPIVLPGEKPPPPSPPPPPIALALDVRATNQIFVRGDGLFAEFGGHLHIGGTLAAPAPQGALHLIRGNFSLAGKTLQFTQGTIGFSGSSFLPTLDIEASTVSNSTTSTLIVGGTAAKPTITLTSTPPLPSDEILAQLLFGESTGSLSAFQAASLATALAQISGVGGGLNPLDKLRNALGLDELSLSGSGSSAPAIQAGRYVAPGVYVGASQATSGQGTQANVQINLYDGLKLQTSTGTSSAGSGTSSSIGLNYQFNY
jgi:translocation and assembly module TamB